MTSVVVDSSQTLSLNIVDAGEVFLPIGVTGEVSEGDTIGEIKIILDNPESYADIITTGEDTYVIHLGGHPVLRVDEGDMKTFSCLRCEDGSHHAHSREESACVHGMYVEHPCSIE